MASWLPPTRRVMTSTGCTSGGCNSSCSITCCADGVARQVQGFNNLRNAAASTEPW